MEPAAVAAAVAAAWMASMNVGRQPAHVGAVRVRNVRCHSVVPRAEGRGLELELWGLGFGV